MARNPIEIPILVDTGASNKALQAGLIEPLEDAQRELDELGRNNGPEQLERALEDAQDETKRLKKETKETADAIEREYRDSYRGASRDVEDFGDRTSHVSKEVGGELKANLGESLSSFRGDLRDIPQLAQDTLGGLAGAGALGGIPGLAAVAAGAAGLGLISAAIDGIEEEQDKLNDSTRAWSDQYVASGRMVLDTAFLVSETQRIINDDYDAAAKNAEIWGVSIGTAAQAMAGAPGALLEVKAALQAQTEAVEAAKDEQALYNDQLGGVGSGAQSLAASKLDQGTKAYERLTDAQQKARDTATTVMQAMIDIARQTEGAVETVDEFGDSIIALPDGTQVYIDAETGRATSNVDEIEKRIFGLQGTTVGIDADISRAQRTIDELRGKRLTIVADLVDRKGNAMNLP